MPLNINDLIIKDVWYINGFDLETGKLLFRLKNTTSCDWQNTSTETEVRGGRNNPLLAVFSGETSSTLVVENAVFDLGLLALQAGDDDGIQATDINVPVSETFTVSSETTYTAKLKYTPSVDSAILTARLDDGTILVEGETASATAFTVAGNTLTFTEDHKGKTGTVFYETASAEAISITVNSDAPVRNCRLVAEATLVNNCGNKLSYMGSLIMPVASISKEFNIATAASGDASVQNVTFKSQSLCGNTKLAQLLVWDEKGLA